MRERVDGCGRREQGGGAAAGPQPETFTVIAAGRALVAAPRAFSKPFASWEPREALRRQLLEYLAGTGLACPASPDGLFAMLPSGEPVDPGRARPAFRSRRHAIYHLPEDACLPRPQ